MKDERVKAWQPLTFGGVARYGHDWVGKVFFACLVVSILTAAVVLWAAARAWFPVIEEAITRLPPGAEIRGGKLTAPQPIRLAENLFLSLGLDPVGEATPPSLSDIQVVLARYQVQLRSILGAQPIAYRPEWTLVLSENDLEPKWAAWRPAVLAYLFFGTVSMLFATWISLGILYAIPVRILAAVLRRSVSLWGSWKMVVAALLPAAILLTAVIFVYALGQIRIAELTFAWVLHFVVGWIFVVGATFRLPLKKTKTNPFGGHELEDSSGQEEEEVRPSKNPFKRAGVGKRR